MDSATKVDVAHKMSCKDSGIFKLLPFTSNYTCKSFTSTPVALPIQADKD